jgi:hypothetical protein
MVPQREHDTSNQSHGVLQVWDCSDAFYPRADATDVGKLCTLEMGRTQIISPTGDLCFYQPNVSLTLSHQPTTINLQQFMSLLCCASVGGQSRLSPIVTTEGCSTFSRWQTAHMPNSLHTRPLQQPARAPAVLAHAFQTKLPEQLHWQQHDWCALVLARLHNSVEWCPEKQHPTLPRTRPCWPKHWCTSSAAV